jgi:hypothetical protein
LLLPEQRNQPQADPVSFETHNLSRFFGKSPFGRLARTEENGEKISPKYIEYVHGSNIMDGEWELTSYCKGNLTNVNIPLK